jgi:hypothetical protein
LARERSAVLVKLKERLVLEREGKLACEVCGFDFAASYGEIGVGFIEAHHLVPIAVQTLMIVIDLDLLEDLTPRFSLGGEELTIRKRFRFQRTNKRLGFGIIVTISTDAHAHLRLNSNKGTKCDMASSPNPFCTLRFVSLD